MEFPRQGLEGVRRFRRPGQFSCALRQAGIDVVGKQFVRLVAALSSLRERYGRVGPKASVFALPLKR